ncbi:response regulator [Flavihumibacter solisilvae]|nr:response regulator [Flavihumibacter solisilvae]
MIQCLLLIDDDPEELDILTEALNGVTPRIRCVYAKGAEAALKVLHQITPDVVFIDINMPKIDGIECLALLRNMKLPEQVDVFIYSNFIDDKVCKLALEMGAKDCIKKPYSILQLKAILRKVLQVADADEFVQNRK